MVPLENVNDDTIEYADRLPGSSLTLVQGRPRLEIMEVRLTPDQEELISRAISSGRFRSAEDAIEEAMSLWEDRERRRTEILAAIDIAEASIAHGKGRIITEQDMQNLAAEVKARGRNRLASERPGPR